MHIEPVLTFKIQSRHKIWDRVGQLMQNGRTGADLQDEVDAFGEEAADHLEGILDAFDSAFLIANYQRTGDQVQLVFDWPPGMEKLADRIKGWLEACGADECLWRVT